MRTTKMFLNEDFLQIWEELSELNEAKADTQKLVDFAGQDIADRFLAIKNKLKAPENDLYYWIKNKTPEELEHAINKTENTKSNTQAKKEIADQGAELVCSSEHWNVYHITTFEASQKYGRDTKWCITGINNWGDKYWNEYKENGIDFYFLINKEEYDARGKYSKVAIALHKNKRNCEVFNQQDTPITLSKIPYLEEITIPGLDIKSLEDCVYCFECGEPVNPGDIYFGPHDECYCHDCFDNNYFKCKGCGDLHFAYIASYENEHGDKYCLDCYYGSSFSCDKLDQITVKASNESGRLTREDFMIFQYKVYSAKPFMNFEGIATSVEDLHRRIINAISNGSRENKETTKVEIVSSITGELIYKTLGVSNNTTKEVLIAVEDYLNSYN